MGFIRFLLAASVLNTHVKFSGNFLFIRGDVAVIIFYIISGFYMSLIINEKYSKGTHWIRRFYLNRLLRLFPAYWAVIVISCLYTYLIGGNTIFSNYMGLSEGKYLALAFANVFLFGLDITRMLGSAGYDPSFVYAGYIVPFAWTLGVELTFYLFAPFVVRKGLRESLIIVAALLGLRLIILYLGWPHMTWRYLFSPSVMIFFMLGHLSYLLYRKVRDLSIPPQVGVFAILGILIYLSQSLIGGGGLYENDFDSPRNWLFYLLMAISIPSVFRLTKKSGLDNFIGQLSYPFYIGHNLALVFVSNTFHDPDIDKGLLAFALTVIFALFLNFAIERPIDRLVREKIAPNKNVFYRFQFFEMIKFLLEFPAAIARSGKLLIITFWIIVFTSFFATIDILDSTSRGVHYYSDDKMIGPEFWSGRKFVDVAKENWKIPSQLPGPDDLWAGGERKRLILKPPYTRSSTYTINIIESHKTSPPVIDVFSGDSKIESFQVPKGSGSPPHEWYSSGKRSSIVFHVPEKFLSSNKPLVIQASKGSWVIIGGISVHVAPAWWEYFLAVAGWVLVGVWLVASIISNRKSDTKASTCNDNSSF